MDRFLLDPEHARMVKIAFDGMTQGRLAFSDWFWSLDSAANLCEPKASDEVPAWSSSTECAPDFSGKSRSPSGTANLESSTEQIS